MIAAAGRKLQMVEMQERNVDVGSHSTRHDRLRSHIDAALKPSPYSAELEDRSENGTLWWLRKFPVVEGGHFPKNRAQYNTLRRRDAVIIRTSESLRERAQCCCSCSK